MVLSKFIVIQPSPQPSFRTLWLSLLLPKNIISSQGRSRSPLASAHLCALALPLHPLLIPLACQRTQFCTYCSVSLPRCLHWALLLPSLHLWQPLEARAHGSSMYWKDMGPGAPDLHLNHDHVATSKSLCILEPWFSPLQSRYNTSALLGVTIRHDVCKVPRRVPSMLSE